MQGIDVNYAWAFQQHGFSIFPVDPVRKSPIISHSWNEYRDRLPTHTEIGDWYLNDRPVGVAMVCGRGSRNVEGIDLDNKGTTTADVLLAAWRERVELRAPGLYARLTIERTRGGGFHALYRCEFVEGNQKLASGLNALGQVVTLIETRGEGGYLVTAPTVGYTLVQGRFSTIPTITPDERAILFDEARALTEVQTPEPAPRPFKATVIGNRPGDDYNGRGDIETVLVAHGWKIVRRAGDVTYWRRPGKTDGISATLNYIPGVFFNFSSNADPFDYGAYTPFAVYTKLEHGGDFKRAATQLHKDGYGGRDDFDEKAWKAKQSKRPTESHELQLYDWLQDNADAGASSATNADIAQAMDRSERTIRRWLEALETRGLIRREAAKTGRWIRLLGADNTILDNCNVPSNVNASAAVSTPTFPVCEQCKVGELRPDDSGIVCCTECTQLIPAASIVNEALDVYAHVPTRAAKDRITRLDLIEHYVIENGRPDLPFSRIVLIYNALIADRQRQKDDARFTEKLHGLSRKQLQRKEHSTATKADELARDGKRGEAFVWSRMAWLTSMELERRESMGLDQRAAEMRKALGRAGMVKQAMFEGVK